MPTEPPSESLSAARSNSLLLAVERGLTIIGAVPFLVGLGFIYLGVRVREWRQRG